MTVRQVGSAGLYIRSTKRSAFRRTSMINNECLDSGTCIRRKNIPPVSSKVSSHEKERRVTRAYLEDATDPSRGASVQTEESG